MDFQNQPPQPNQPFNQDDHKTWFGRHMLAGYVFAVVILVLIVWGIYAWQSPDKGSDQLPLNNDQTNNQLPVADDNAQSDPTANWKTYRNEEFGFEFKYPEDVSVSEGKPISGFYQYNALEINLQKISDNDALPSIILGIANDASIAAHKPPEYYDESEPRPFSEFRPLSCEQFYENQQPGIYNNAVPIDGPLFSYMVLTIAGKQACSENIDTFFGERAFYKAVVFYGSDDTRYQFRVYLGYGGNDITINSRDIITNSTDTDLEELEQKGMIYSGSQETVMLLNQILSTFRFID